jgi:protein CpxP
MKKLFLVCAFLIGISAVSFAQGGGGGGQRRTPEEQAAALKTSLTLTDAQVAKATVIFTAASKSIDSLRTAMAGGDRAAMRPAMMAIRTAASDKLMAILTPDQAAIYKKQLADQQAAMKARMQGGN